MGWFGSPHFWGGFWFTEYMANQDRIRELQQRVWEAKNSAEMEFEPTNQSIEFELSDYEPVVTKKLIGDLAIDRALGKEKWCGVEIRTVTAQLFDKYVIRVKGEVARVRANGRREFSLFARAFNSLDTEIQQGVAFCQIEKPRTSATFELVMECNHRRGKPCRVLVTPE